MPALRCSSVLVLLTVAALASEAQAGPRTGAKHAASEAREDEPAATIKPATEPAKAPTRPRESTVTRARARSKASAPVPKDSKVEVPGKPAARPLHPRRDPLLARHPAATCALDPLEAVGLRQHGRARESLREFYWSDMARFFETAADNADPVPQQVTDPAFVATEQVLRDLPSAVRTPLATIAGARVVDRLGEREFARVSKLLASLAPAQVAGLLRADAPTLRAYVWTWLATTKTGGCHLGHLDLDFIEAAVADRSVAVEHGDDLVYRSLGDYALAARARLATLDGPRFDAFLVRLTTAAEVDPLVRATAHGVLLRRGHWETQATGLRDASPSVRAATAAAAIEMNRDRVEPTMLEHAAGDPADLVTELIVGALLGVYDPHNQGRPVLRGPLTSTRDERLAATVARWRGRGDPLEPLPAPHRPLRFDAPVRAESVAAAPVPAASPAPTAAEQPVPSTSLASTTPTRPVPSASPVASTEPEPRRPREPSLPGVLDEPDDELPPGAP
ncbi:MAG TPA: hypothetical protein VGB85_06520 [Nannocystis sp.]|jgi:hypothetical protein